MLTLATPRKHVELALSFLHEASMPRGNNNDGNTNENANVVESTIERHIHAMLWKSQPGNFSAEGHEIGKGLEEWIEGMDDYFDFAQSTEENKVIMVCFKLEKTAKLWWKDHYLENHINPRNATWHYIKTQLKKTYQSRTCMVERINEFLDCNQEDRDLEGY